MDHRAVWLKSFISQLFFSPSVTAIFEEYPVDSMIQLIYDQSCLIPDTNIRLNPASIVLIPARKIGNKNYKYADARMDLNFCHNCRVSDGDNKETLNFVADQSSQIVFSLGTLSA